MFFDKIKLREAPDAIIFYPCWGCNAEHLKRLYGWMFKKKSCIFYNYPSSILTSDPSETKKNILEVVRDSIETIKNYRNVNLFGASLGSFIALKVASLEPKVKKLLLVTAGDSLAEAVWFGKATQKLREAMEMNNISLNKLKEEWEELLPDYHHINKKIILLIQSKRDTTILPESQMRLLEKLANNNLIIEHHLIFDHTLTVLLGTLRIRLIYKFLRD